jgi:hypothetical protein
MPQRFLFLLVSLIAAFQRPLLAARPAATPSHSVVDSLGKDQAPDAAESTDADDEDSAVDDAALKAEEQRYQDLKRQVRERKRQRRESGAPNGWLISTHVDLITSLSSRYVPSGSFMGLDIEKALGAHSGLKFSWAGSTVGSDYNSSGPQTTWEAGLQLRAYPLDRGYLNGFFAGIGLHYAEVIYQGSYSTWDPISFSYVPSAWHSYGHALGIGPVLGYQWIIGRAIAITLETSYRYHWVQDDLSNNNYSYYYGPSQGNTYNTNSLDFKSGVGWAF